MPTDIVMVLKRNAEAKEQAHRDMADLTIIACLWSALGLVLTVLMFILGFDPALTEVLVVVG